MWKGTGCEHAGRSRVPSGRVSARRRGEGAAASRLRYCDESRIAVQRTRRSQLVYAVEFRRCAASYRAASRSAPDKRGENQTGKLLKTRFAASGGDASNSLGVPGAQTGRSTSSHLKRPGSGCGISRAHWPAAPSSEQSCGSPCQGPARARAPMSAAGLRRHSHAWRIGPFATAPPDDKRCRGWAARGFRREADWRILHASSLVRALWRGSSQPVRRSHRCAATIACAPGHDVGDGIAAPGTPHLQAAKVGRS